MKTLVFDTETTGLHNPYIVQLAARLFVDRSPVSTLNVIVKPVDSEGNTVIIPDAVSAIHGITTDMAERCGIEIKSALVTFLDMLLVADRVVAHNMRFDRTVLFGEMHRNFMLEEVASITGVFSAMPVICTMATSTPICRLPKKSGYGFKWPKLTEAHEFFLGTSFDGAHDALNDVNACARVLAALEDAGHKLVEV